MALKSSCTTRFRSSVARCRELKIGPTNLMTSATATISSGTITRNTWLSRRLMRSAIITAVMSMTGARTSMRMPIMSIICTDETSLVRRVMSEAVEKCSMLENENFCTCVYSARRRFAPKPMPAREESAAAPMPSASEHSAISTIFVPVARI